MALPPTLTAEMIDELDAFLSSEAAPENCMQLSDLDGFLTGLVVGPDLILPSEWLPVVWGDDDPEFADIDEAERMIGIILARYNQIANMLHDGGPGFDPIIYEAHDGTPLAGDWASGFMDAFGLCANAWNPLFEDEEAMTMIFPVLIHLPQMEDEFVADMGVDALEEARNATIDLLPQAMQDLYQFWLKRRQPPAEGTARRTTKKVGRNQPCPCGSGKKHQRCRGA